LAVNITYPKSSGKKSWRSRIPRGVAEKSTASARNSFTKTGARGAWTCTHALSKSFAAKAFAKTPGEKMNKELIKKAASNPLVLGIVIGLGMLEYTIGLPMWLSAPAAMMAIVLARYAQLKRHEAKQEDGE
jgi:hypothetical protein